MRTIFILLLSLCSVTIAAQESQYEQMKQSLDEHSLPLVNMIVDIGKVNKQTFVAGEIEIADFQQRTDPSSLTVRYNCKYRLRGRTALAKRKKSFAVKLFDETGEDLDANIFGIRKENSWILDAMAIDRIRMRNRICFDVWNEINRTPYDTKYDNRNGTKGLFVEVFINGTYQGLYCMTDKVDRKLLGLKKAKVEGDGAVSIRGILYKGYNWKKGVDLLSYNEASTDIVTWNAFELDYPEDYPSIDTWQPLMDLIDFCSDVTPDEVFVEEYQDYFYLSNLIDFVVFANAMYIRDHLYYNTFLSVIDINLAHRFLLTPWDMDTSLGGDFNGAYHDEVVNVDRFARRAGPFNRLGTQNIDGFNDLLAAKWKEYSETLFSCDSISRRLDHYAEQFTVSGAWERERAKWNGNPVPLMESIYDELEYVKDWYARNYDNLCDQYGTNGIDSIHSDENPSSHSGIYTLDGRKFEGNVMQKGIYIVNGKKVVVK